MRASSSTSSASRARSCKGVVGLLAEGSERGRRPGACALVVVLVVVTVVVLVVVTVAVLVAVRPAVFRAPEGLALLGPAAWCSRGRRPAREIATREPSARSDRSRSPASPCRRPRVPQPGSAVARCPPNSRGLARLEISRFRSTQRRPSCTLLVVVASIDLSIPRLFLLIGAVHPIRRHCTSSDRVHRH